MMTAGRGKLHTKCSNSMLSSLSSPLRQPATLLGVLPNRCCYSITGAVP